MSNFILHDRVARKYGTQCAVKEHAQKVYHAGHATRAEVLANAISFALIRAHKAVRGSSRQSPTMPLARRIATTAIARPIGVSRSGRADTAAGAGNQVPRAACRADIASQAAERAAADIEGHSATAGHGQPGRLSALESMRRLTPENAREPVADEIAN
jgi:hypothetical protein